MCLLGYGLPQASYVFFHYCTVATTTTTAATFSTTVACAAAAITATAANLPTQVRITHFCAVIEQIHYTYCNVQTRLRNIAQNETIPWKDRYWNAGVAP